MEAVPVLRAQLPRDWVLLLAARARVEQVFLLLLPKGVLGYFVGEKGEEKEGQNERQALRQMGVTSWRNAWKALRGMCGEVMLPYKDAIDTPA